MTTNGFSLNRKNFLNLIANANCKQFEITLDGDETSHDQRRWTKSGGHSFQIIYKNLLDILSDETSLAKNSIRCNVDKNNYDNIIPLLEKLHRDGLHKKLASIYMAPIHSWGNNAQKDALLKSEFANWEMDIILKMMKLEFPVHLFPKRKKRLCLATSTTGYLIDPSGGIFACTEVSLVPSYEVKGKNIHQLGSISLDKSEQVSNSNIFSLFHVDIKNNKYDCGQCFLLPICGGRCPKEWHEGRSPCPSLKENFKQRTILHYLLSKKRLSF